MRDAQRAAIESPPGEVTQHALASFDSMRRRGIRLVQSDILGIEAAGAYDEFEKIEALTAEIDTINARVDSEKKRLKSRDQNSRLADATSEMRDKEIAERATCPGPKQVTTYSYMGKIVTHKCQSKLRRARLKKAKV
jgi:hypothetical protein